MGLFDKIKSAFSSRTDISKRFARQRKSISGTMSEFFMARDIKSGDLVGLKILDPEKTAAFEARFPGLEKPSEGEISMLMQHPRIVETYEYGLTTDGRQYLVMEFLDGTDMNSLIIGKDERLNGNRLTLLRQSAEAVAYVHSMGFIHRDICPRNLFVSPDGTSLKLTDFGLTIPATKPFMQPGNRTGTVNYMAPELARRRETDRRVDVFALGVTSYELVTGELPWPHGDTGLAALTHDTPPTDIREVRPNISPIVANAIMQCIEPNVSKRCESIEQYMQRLRAARTLDE